MLTNTDTIYRGISLGLDVFSLLVSLVLAYAIATEKSVKKTEVKYFSAIVGFNALCAACDFGVCMNEGNAVNASSVELLANLSFVFSMFVLLFFCFYQYHMMRQRVYVSGGINYSSAFTCNALWIVLLIGNIQEKPWFIKVSPQGLIERQPAYIVLPIVVCVLLLFNFFLILSDSKHLSRHELFAWISYEIFPGIIYIIYFATGFFREAFMYAAASLSIILVYINIHISGIRESIETENRLNKSQMQLMVSQIQPHFLYNSLNSIYALIDQDPEIAQEAVSTFSDYLRQNINALKKDEPVEFEEEMEHTKAYLYLEKIRFGDKLNIEFDIKAKDFKIPPLSVQPLVENAIKHGISQKPGGGKLKIASWENETENIIQITDDGKGFEAGKFSDDKKSTHVGMFNVSTRIQAMVSGKLSVNSVPGQGTVCTIIIPKDKKR